MDATVLCASAPNGLPSKSPSVHIGPDSSSPDQLPSSNAETEIRHTSEPNDIRERPTAVSPPVNGAQAVSSARRKDHYQPVDDAYSTRFATKCHPDADAVRAELDAFFGKHWPWPSDNAREVPRGRPLWLRVLDLPIRKERQDCRLRQAHNPVLPA